MITEPPRPGIYRRPIRVRAVQGAVHAEMEDDAHTIEALFVMRREVLASACR